MSVEQRLANLLVERGKTLAVAESCTGGLLAHRLTNIPGASAYFLGGVVAYANAVKEALLRVRAETLKAHGAVSEAVVAEMAQGVRERLGADLAIATSGIAGPSGGTVEKPVGTLCLGCAGPGWVHCQTVLIEGDRLQFKQKAVDFAIEGLLESLSR